MNIVVIGSCTDSSILAKELNKRLHDSIIARIDLLKNIKQLVLQDRVETTNENLGAYVGDVETYNFNRISPELKKKLTASIEAIKDVVVSDSKDSIYKQQVRKSTIASTFDALTNSLPVGTYSFIKVYSGAVEDTTVSAMVRDSNFLANAIFVSVKSPQDALLPITVSKETVESLKKSAFAYVECEKVTEVFSSEVFQLLFEVDNEKKPTTVEVKTETKAVVEAPRDAVAMHFLNNGMVARAAA